MMSDSLESVGAIAGLKFVGFDVFFFFFGETTKVSRTQAASLRVFRLIKPNYNGFFFN